VKVVAASAAGVLSMKMIEYFRPKYLAMTGILAGMRGGSEPGDIVAADPSWDYGSGKRARQDGKSYSQRSHTR
jgi:nucleoside phosphorylase